MSLKCSVFGHDFGPTETDREREEKGDEVVTTIRETETCNRCDTTQVITENTEVTHIDTGPTPAPEPTDEPPTTAPSTDPAAESVTDGGDSAVDPSTSASPDTTTVTETEPDGPDTLSTLPTAGPDDSDPETGEITSADDDGVILDPTNDERPPGEWPKNAPTEEDGYHAAWPANPTGDMGSPAEYSKMPSTAGTADETAQASETDVDGPDETAVANAPADEPETVTQTDPRPGPIDGVMTVPRGEFRCRECGHTESVASSSLRAGDFCPTCATGTLDHVTDSS